MNSTKLLIKSLHQPLLIGGAVVFVVMCWLGWAEDPSGPEKVSGLLGLVLIIAMFVACFSGLHTALFRLPFPVSARQRAWIPTLCLAILCIVGLIGLCAGVALCFSVTSWKLYLYAAIKIFPVFFLAFAFMDRLVRYLGIGAVFCMSLFQVLFFTEGLEGMEYLFVLYQFSWPLFIVLGVFFILEGPMHIASMDHPQAVTQGMIKSYIRTPGSPNKMPRIKFWADLLMGLIILPLVMLYFSQLDIGSGWAKVGLAKIYAVGICMAIVFAIRQTWRRTQANGFGAIKSLVLFFMQCSLVLIPITWVLGAKRGLVATCNTCQRYKFLWARQCPRCGELNQGTLLRFWPSLPWKRKDSSTPIGQMKVPARWGYRYILPYFLILFSISLSSGTFKYEIISLILKNQDQGATFTEIRDYLASIDDAREWLNADGGEPLQLPEHFRIEVEEAGVGVLEIRCYWLHWEEAGEVSEKIQSLIVQEISETNLNPSDGGYRSEYGSRVNRLKANNFLDGQIHWKAL